MGRNLRVNGPQNKLRERLRPWLTYQRLLHFFFPARIGLTLPPTVSDLSRETLLSKGSAAGEDTGMFYSR